MPDAKMQIDIPGADFNEMARGVIAAKLTEAMAGADDMIAKIIAVALTQKVDSSGKRSQYDYENKHSFVEWLAHDLIRSVTKEVLREKVESLRPMVAAAIEKQLAKETKTIARALTEGFVARAKGGYGVEVNMAVSFKDPNR